MSTGLQYDVLQIFHHELHHDNEKKATDLATQGYCQQKHSSARKIDYHFPAIGFSEFSEHWTAYAGQPTTLQFANHLPSNNLQMSSWKVCDNNTASLDYQEQKTFFSNHLSNLRNALINILVEWFEPEQNIALASDLSKTNFTL